MTERAASRSSTNAPQFEKFDDFARRIFAVPKEEFDAELAKEPKPPKQGKDDKCNEKKNGR